MSARAAEKLEDSPYYDCPYLLKGLFHVVLVGEAHEIKRPSGAGAVAVDWLLPALFLGMATATPDINRVEDERGYLRHIHPKTPVTDELRQ